ncbi:MAG: response regulator, partial [Armatimonadota bacterium]|nr:response regulator [Armatimonadota bacterium]
MQGKTVLLVEDEAAIVDVVRRYLERDGYRVVVASEGQRAVDEFRRLRPDLVLLDLMLPGLDGWEV